MGMALGLIILFIIIIGIIILCIVRCCIAMYDRREYARFEKELERSKWEMVSFSLNYIIAQWILLRCCSVFFLISFVG